MVGLRFELRLLSLSQVRTGNKLATTWLRKDSARVGLDGQAEPGPQSDLGCMYAAGRKRARKLQVFMQQLFNYPGI
jgi:hypothetical protein